MKHEYVRCECSTPEHVVAITWDEDDNDWSEIYVNVHLNVRLGFFRRLWLALKYIFGFDASYGHFAESLWGREQVLQMRALCERWLAAHPELPWEFDDVEMARRVLEFRRRILGNANEQARKAQVSYTELSEWLRLHEETE